MYRGGINGRNARRAAAAAGQPVLHQADDERQDLLRREVDDIAGINAEFAADAEMYQSDAAAAREEVLRNLRKQGYDADIILLAGLYDPANRPQAMVDLMAKREFRDVSSLNELLQIMFKKLPAKTIDDLQRIIFSEDFVKLEKISMHKNDYPQWGDGDRRHRCYKLWYLLSVGQRQPWADLIASPSGAAWKKLYHAIDYLHHLSLLKRFADDRNPEVASKPLPDGSNLTHPDLRISWVLHKQFLRTLHYRSLVFTRIPLGIKELEQINYLSMLLYYNELQSVPLQNRKLHIPNDLKFVWDSYDDLEERLQSIARALSVEERYNPLQYTFEQTMISNINDSIKFEGIVDQFLYQGNDAHEWQLWAHLAQITEDFDDRMDVEHVEDVLIERRVVVPDEEYELAELLKKNGRFFTTNLIDDMVDEAADQDLVTPRLRKIEQVNRFRRNHLLLKDWNKKRPWRQLYYIYDTSDNGKPYRDLIDDFYKEGSDLESYPSRQYDDDSPSRIAGIWSGFYPIKPMASHSKDAPNLPQPNLPFFQDGCSICMYPYEKNQTIAELFCDHLCHYKCLRNYWDVGKKYRTDCPMCRHDWALDEVADITPEVRDVWDNVRVTSDSIALAEPDMDHLWEDLQAAALVDSEKWDDLREPTYGTPRSVWLEMVHLRIRRAHRNCLRRERYNLPGIGMQQYQADAMN